VASLNKRNQRWSTASQPVLSTWHHAPSSSNSSEHVCVVYASFWCILRATRSHVGIDLIIREQGRLLWEQTECHGAADFLTPVVSLWSCWLLWETRGLLLACSPLSALAFRDRRISWSAYLTRSHHTTSLWGHIYTGLAARWKGFQCWMVNNPNKSDVADYRTVRITGFKIKKNK
jgi:hypothetical protein